MRPRARHPSKKRSAGFTLIELMIAVGIVGILAAIAIPEYQKYTLRAKQAEALTIMSMIKNAEYTHYSLHDCFVNIEKTPVAGAPGILPQFWDSMVSGNADRPCTDPADRSFEDLTVRPNRPAVLYEYQCRARFSAGGGVTDEFTCSSYGDIDGDGQFFELVYGTDNDGDGQTLPSAHGTVSFFPNDPVRISVGIY